MNSLNAPIIPPLFQSTFDFTPPDALESAHSLNQDILGGTMVAVGLVVTFVGAKYLKQLIFFIGLVAGGFLAYFMTPFCASWVGSKVAENTLSIISLVFGVICGAFLVFVYKVSVFTIGALCGAIVSQILWILVVSNIEEPDENYMIAVRIGVFIVFAFIGAYLAFKFVEQVMKAGTAFLGSFSFTSGVAYFIGRLDGTEERNVIDWVVFFGDYENYSQLEQVCDAYCMGCIVLWAVMFVAGCFVQYKLIKKRRRYRNVNQDDGRSSESEAQGFLI